MLPARESKSQDSPLPRQATILHPGRGVWCMVKYTYLQRTFILWRLSLSSFLFFCSPLFLFLLLYFPLWVIFLSINQLTRTMLNRWTNFQRSSFDKDYWFILHLTWLGIIPIEFPWEQKKSCNLERSGHKYDCYVIPLRLIQLRYGKRIM